jgi:arylsulfatase A-like enzyme
MSNQGYDPILVGYGDFGNDWRALPERDPLLQDSDGGPVPGMTPLMPWNHMAGHAIAWCDFMEDQGYEVPEHMYKSFYDLRGQYKPDPAAMAAGYPEPAFYATEHSDTAFAVNSVLRYVRSVRGHRSRILGAPGWALHLSLLKPHPPWIAPAPYNTMYHPDDVDPPVRADGGPAAEAAAHPWLEMHLKKLVAGGAKAIAQHNANFKRDRALYYGLVSETDAHLGRLFDYLRDSGELDRTLIIFSADHGEQCAFQLRTACTQKRI